jgi:RNA polymerase sigma factor (sigma-70 family)
MYHQWISWWRRGRYGREYAVATAREPSPSEDVAVDSSLRVALAKVLSQLTAKQRAVVVLRYYEDLSESEVARVLGCSVGAVRSQAYRTLARLRELCPDLAPEKELDSA